MYDVVIVGGGPSGSTLAKFLKEDLKVLVIDKRNLSESNNFSNEKSCGGLLSPDAQKALTKLGLGVPNNILVGPQVFSVKTFDFDNNLERYYQRHYININRELFDRWLFKMIPSKVEIKTKSLFKGFSNNNGVISVYIIEDNMAKTVQTRILVGADGATSKVRRDMNFKNDNIKIYASIQKSYKTDKEVSSYYAFFNKEVNDYYSWAIQKDNNLVVGSAIEKGKDVNKKFKLLEENLMSKGFNLDNCVKSEGTWILRPKRIKDIKLCKEKVVLIGESAGLISPSSAEGISYALTSGKYLAESINKSLDRYETIYKRKIIRIRIKLYLKNYKSIIIYNRIIRKIILGIGVGSINSNLLEE